jgi:Putative protein-S-isoprenylcysteine methyltransferase
MPARLFAIVRTLIVSSLFVSLWTWFLPRWIIGRSAFAAHRPLGWIVIACGAVIAGGCIFEFAWRGIGTPAPFDPPRRLVISGPYRWVRNPMYLGFGLVLLGETATFPRLTITMPVLCAIGWCATSIFIIGFEEPVLRSKFGEGYDEYCRNVRRWIPRRRPW